VYKLLSHERYGLPSVKLVGYLLDLKMASIADFNKLLVCFRVRAVVFADGRRFVFELLLCLKDVLGRFRLHRLLLLHLPDLDGSHASAVFDSAFC